MKDGIIKGSGNSRYLRTVANALTLYPNYESFIAALIQGTFPIDLNGINSSGWSAVGTKLNKAALLTDSLCSALGLSTSATPNQAMDKLRQLVNTAQSSADVKGNAKSISGSYTGTGDTTKTLDFGFPPKLCLISDGQGFIQGYSSGKEFRDAYIWINGLRSGAVSAGSSSAGYFNVSVSGNTMTITKRSGDLNGLNHSGTTYYYVAIG